MHLRKGKKETKEEVGMKEEASMKERKIRRDSSKINDVSNKPQVTK
jgi:hypothetical protein